MLDEQQPYQVCVTNVLNILLFECKLFNFDLLSNISLSCVLIGYMNVIYKELDTFSFDYMPWGIWPLVSTSPVVLLWHCWDALSRSNNATVWTILTYIGDELHNINCLGKREGNWLMIYASYLFGTLREIVFFRRDIWWLM
jgi:hypothetical protein